MTNLVIGAVALLIFSFYDPSLIIYQVGLVDELAVLVIGLLALFNSDKLSQLIWLQWRRDRAMVVFCGLWLAWGMYFVLHGLLGLTSWGFVASRLVRISFAVLFFLNIRRYLHFNLYVKVLVALAAFYSFSSVLFHVVTFVWGVPGSTMVHVPVVDVEYAALGFYGYMWPGNYNFPMQLGGVSIYRITSFFNESAAYAFFLEPMLFYVLYLRHQARHKGWHNLLFLIVLGGVIASTSIAGIVSVLLAMSLVVWFREMRALKRLMLSMAIALVVTAAVGSGALYFDDVISGKQATIAMEVGGLERGMGLLSGVASIVGTGYDFVRDSFYVSSNAFLSNLQRGGLIGLVLFAASVLMNLWLVMSIGVRRILAEGRYAAFALIPNFIHLGIKVNYEFTFIYLINYCLVFWYLNYVRRHCSAAVGPS